MPEVLSVNVRFLRLYLRSAVAESGLEVLRDALASMEPGVMEVLRLFLQLRCNPRTRRTVLEVRQQFWSTRAAPRWYTVLPKQLLSSGRW